VENHKNSTNFKSRFVLHDLLAAFPFEGVIFKILVTVTEFGHSKFYDSFQKGRVVKVKGQKSRFPK